MWADHKYQVYSNRTDLTPEAWRFLVMLTLSRRTHVTAANARQLWEADQVAIADLLDKSRRSFQEEKP